MVYRLGSDGSAVRLYVELSWGLGCPIVGHLPDDLSCSFIESIVAVMEGLSSSL